MTSGHPGIYTTLTDVTRIRHEGELMTVYAGMSSCPSRKAIR